jgi:hypothetical protein
MSQISFPEAVRRTSELAHARLPESLHGNIQRATAIVLGGGVVYDEDGKHAMVRASNGQTWYPVNGHCTCMGAPHAPEGLCKHALAARIYQRAGDLMRDGLSAQPTGTDARPAPSAAAHTLPEAAFSLCLKGRLGGQDAQLTIRGATYAEFAANVQAVRALLDAPSAPAQATPAQGAPACPTHGPMKPSSKAPGTFYCTKKNYDGSYCKSRYPGE